MPLTCKPAFDLMACPFFQRSATPAHARLATTRPPSLGGIARTTDARPMARSEPCRQPLPGDRTTTARRRADLGARYGQVILLTPITPRSSGLFVEIAAQDREASVSVRHEYGLKLARGSHQRCPL